MGDLHGQAAARLHKSNQAKEADGIIVGDPTVTGGAAQARTCLRSSPQSRHLRAQIGNMDRAEVTDWLAKQGWNTPCVRVSWLLAGVAPWGLAAASHVRRSVRRANFPSPRFATGSNTWREARTYRHVLSVHTPPHDTLCDIVVGTESTLVLRRMRLHSGRAALMVCLQ